MDGRLESMTTPVPLPPKSTDRGLVAMLATAGIAALAWLCAMVYVVAAWVAA